MSEVRTPQIKLTYNSNDITVAVEKYLIGLTYLDRTEAESDELDVELDDSDGRWSNKWFPDKGARLELQMGFDDKLTLIGVFEIDEIGFNYDSSGRTVSMRALSALVTQPLRTKRDVAYENITLKRLAQTVATRGHLVVSGKIENITISRVTQFHETDLAFLKRIAFDYDYVFSIKAGKLVFTHMPGLRARNSAKEYGPDNLNSINITDATGRTFRVAQHKYYDPAKGRNTIVDAPGNGNGTDIFEETGAVENKQQAELRAQARIAKLLDGQTRGRASLQEGDPLLVAGNNVTFVGVGKFSGVYNIEASTHIYSKGSGYQTSVDFFKVNSVTDSQF